MVGVILAGGGRGRRIGDFPKAFLKIDKKPLLYYSLEKFHRDADEIVVVLPENYTEEWKEKIERRYTRVRVVPGGAHRQDSVKKGLSALDMKEGIVLIHDVARPFFSISLIKRIIEGVHLYGAVVPYIEPEDTLKERKGDFIERTLDRNSVVCIQTPQGFRLDIIRKAYEQAYKDGFYATDDAGLVEHIGMKVYLVKGERENIKITYPFDIEIAKEIIKKWKGQG